MRIAGEDCSREDPPNTVTLRWARALPVEEWGAGMAGGQGVRCMGSREVSHHQLALVQGKIYSLCSVGPCVFEALRFHRTKWEKGIEMTECELC